MSKSARYAKQVLEQELNAQAPWWSAQTQLWVSLHSRDPGPNGDQSTAELAYAGYQRQPVERKGWQVSDAGVAPNPALIRFPDRQDGGAAVELRVAVLGTSPNGKGQVLRRALVAVQGGKIVIQQHSGPEFEPGALEFKEQE